MATTLIFKNFKGQLIQIFLELTACGSGIKQYDMSNWVGEAPASDGHIAEYWFSSNIHIDIWGSHMLC